MTFTLGSRRARFGAKMMAFTLVGAMAAAACGSSSSKASSGGSKSSGEKVTLHLGYFPNVTHAPAVYGIQSGSFAKALGSNVTLKPAIFNAGPAADTALLSGAIDASFLGPGPAVTAFTKGNGVVVAGTASGGAFLVVNKSITSPSQLKGKKISSPQLGNTQDIALRWYLKQQGFKTDTNGGGDVHIVPQANAQILTAFKSGDIDGAWVPEPYATRMVKEDGGHVLVNEANLWPGGRFTTTVLVVNKSFLSAHPDVVKSLIGALYDATVAIKSDPTGTASVIAAGITKGAGKTFKASLVTDSEKSITFTLDPIASSLLTVADRQVQLGLGKKQSLNGIFDLSITNEVLKAKGQPAVASS
ncbi:MAG TPA: ABC transporter substrate-binding protein [Acidimicrobiia bacterium]|jgi:NitT/TauT family transport system substrate-binding protein